MGATMTRSDPRALAEHLVSTDRRLWSVVFLVVGLLMSLWALAAPYYSGPDEGLHASRAWSVVHGEILGESANLGGFRFVRVPEWVSADASSVDCYRSDQNVPAGCFTLAPGNQEVISRTAGSQLPFFYALSGIPFLGASRGPGLLLVRLWGAAIAAAFIASAVVTARMSRARRWLVPSILLACPPMVLYIAAVTNPSGLELTAIISLWVSGIVLATEPAISARVALRFAVATFAVMLSRQLGPLWFAVAVVFCCWIAGRIRIMELMRSRIMWRVAAAGAVAFATWAVWNVIARPLVTDASAAAVDLPSSDVLQAQVGRLWGLAQEAVGVLGWLDVRLPFFTYFVWIIGTVLLVALAFVFGRGRLAWGPLLLLAVSIVVQVAGEYPSVSTLGFYWQGRYTLPMLVGVPLLGAVAVGVSARAPRIPRRVVVGGGLAIGSALLLAYYQTLRRYTVGAAGPLQIWKDMGWTPPVPVIVLLLLFLIATGAWVLIGALAGTIEVERSDGAQTAPASF